MIQSIVIVGTGQGGFQVAASLREGGFDGKVILVGEEAGLPYQRPPLSKAYLMGKTDADQVRLRPQKFFDDHRLALLAGEQAIAIDRAARRLILRSGAMVPYDHLVLAVGARNRALPVPGGDLDGVLQLRSLEDAEVLRHRLAAARDVVVVGAGFIGLEFASVAVARGLRVTVIEALDRPMARALSATMSGYFRRVHESLGIRFAFGTTVACVLGEAGRAVGVETQSGRRFPADVVVVGIGVTPNTGLAAEAGLAVANGIVVDAHMLTGDPAISAIGDCAAYPSRHAGGTIRIESVQNAVDQARCVADRLCGRPAPYAGLPWFWSEQGPLKLQIAGLSTPHQMAVTRGDPAAGGFSVFCFAGDRLIGVESVNRPLDHILARKLIGTDQGLTLDQAADPGFDLKRHANGAGVPSTNG